MKGRQLTPRLYAVALTVAIVLSGCDEPTVYRAQEDKFGLQTDGYTDQRVGKNEHSIVAVGTTATTKERTAQLALLRAARLTLEQDHRRFVIIHGTSNPQRIGTDDMIAIPGIATPIHVALGGQRRPTAILIIRLINDDEAPLNALDAKAIEATLAPMFE